MTSKPSRTSQVAKVLFAGVALVAALTMSTVRIIPVDDDSNNVNDQGQNSGDIFTQNAQDQSTA